MTGSRRLPKLVCVGDIDMDLVLKVPRLPQGDEKVGGAQVARSPGGMAANVAVAARRAGADVSLVGVVGDDVMGREALDYLGREDIDLSQVSIAADTATFYCVVLVDDSGEKSLIRATTDAYLPSASDLSAASLSGACHVHMTFTEPALVSRTIALTREVGATLSLDLEAADVPDEPAALHNLTRALDILFISEKSKEVVERKMGAIQLDRTAKIVTTGGARGASVEEEGVRMRVVGHAVDAVDTLGAGDTFAGVFLAAWLAGAQSADALRRANAAAALSTLAYGAQTAMPTGKAIDAFLAEHASEVVYG